MKNNKSGKHSFLGKIVFKAVMAGSLLLTLALVNTKSVSAADVNAQTQAQAEAIAAANAQQAAIAALQAQQAQLAAQQAALQDQMLAAWFSDAGFVGNSVSVGFASYAKNKRGAIFANTTMMAKESYSFQNDFKGKDKYRLSLNGKSGRAKDLIAQAGIRKVFISMGTNDLWSGADSAYTNYVNYINEIRAANPGILFFIQATTPVYNGREKDGLNNKNVDALNAKMAALCASTPDMFYIDICTPLKDANGGLSSAYTSDKFVHVNNAGYKVWTDTVINYVRTLAVLGN